MADSIADRLTDRLMRKRSGAERERSGGAAERSRAEADAAGDADAMRARDAAVATAMVLVRCDGGGRSRMNDLLMPSA